MVERLTGQAKQVVEASGQAALESVQSRVDRLAGRKQDEPGDDEEPQEPQATQETKDVQASVISKLTRFLDGIKERGQVA